MDSSAGELAAAALVICLAERLCAVALFHWVNEAGLLVVAKVSESSDVESSHHLVVLVDEVVAVELNRVSVCRNCIEWALETYHVETVPRCVAGDDLSFLVLGQPDDVL